MNTRVAIGVVSERLGHVSPEFTLHRYSDVMPGMQREAAGTIARAVRFDGGPRAREASIRSDLRIAKYDGELPRDCDRVGKDADELSEWCHCLSGRSSKSTCKTLPTEASLSD